MTQLQYPLAPPRDRELAKLFASKFISRPDVIASQYSNGWFPMQAYKDGPYVPVDMRRLLDHIHGRASYGHYLLNAEGKCKYFAFDLDLEEAKPDKGIFYPVPGPGTDFTWPPKTFVPGSPRDLWKSPRIFEVQRKFLTCQLVSIARKLTRAIMSEFDLPVSVTYSGNKGLHVYGFTGPIDANEAREGALIVLESLGCFEPIRGNNFFKHKQGTGDPIEDYSQVSIEIFPKQSGLDGGKLFGNLMRLPTGVNLKGGESYFVDMRGPLVELWYRDPIDALNTADPWV